MKRILLSRTDSIGDVVLTLPMAGVLKKYFPGTEVLFLGRTYTRPIIEACTFIDQFIDWDSLKGLPWRQRVEAFRGLRADVIIHVFMVMDVAMLADLSGIPVRISTTHRLYGWFFCNKLIWFSRTSSDLHEAQLNLKLLKPLGI
ncbi:MAG: glycosyl transferase family 9, partial [bacterium]